MAQPTLVIMAAGIGSRYGGLKQIDPVGPTGEIIIDYSIYDALQAGFDKAVFIIRKDIEKDFRERIGKKIEKRIDTQYVFQQLDMLPAGFKPPVERVKPWGTAHAVFCVRKVVVENFAVINADDFYGRDSFKVLGDYLRTAKDADGVYNYAMVGFILENTLTEHGHVSRGVCTISTDGFLSSVVERTKIQKFSNTVKYTKDGANWIALPDNSIVSMNMWGFTPSLFNELETRFEKFLEKNVENPKSEFFIPTAINELMQESKARVKVLRSSAKWLGVTYPQDKDFVKASICRMLTRGQYPSPLWQES